ncbi:MAG: hypothetical protein KAU14_01685 [Thermoplasmata archaeon]|nr:hypothetical protein [Thermoplasmata archaeon]
MADEKLATSFEKLEKRIIVSYSVETLSDLRIGGHDATAPGEVDKLVIKDGKGVPIIPGSSLKGVLRSEMERLLRSLGLKACNVHETNGGCGKCTVCYLFGGGRLAGSIRIRDARAETRKTQIRDGVGIDRKTRKAMDGRKYDIEVVPRGVRFTGKVVIENPRLGDGDYTKLDSFLTTVRFFNETVGAIGGATTRGFGEVKINIDETREVTAVDYLEGNFEGRPIDRDDVKGQWRGYLKTQGAGGDR